MNLKEEIHHQNDLVQNELIHTCTTFQITSPRQQSSTMAYESEYETRMTKANRDIAV